MRARLRDGRGAGRRTDALAGAGQCPTHIDACHRGSGAILDTGDVRCGDRLRSAHLNTWNLATFDGELGTRINLNRVEPYFTFAAGYAKIKGDGLADIQGLDIHGFNARAGFGLDYYADKSFTLGFNFTGDLLAMSRPGIDLSTAPLGQATNCAQSCKGLGIPRRSSSAWRRRCTRRKERPSVSQEPCRW